MKQKLLPITGLMMIAMLATVALVLARPVSSSQPNTSADAKAIEATIRQSRIVDLEAGYSLDPSILSTVYANDPRGVLADAAVDQMRELRQDPTIKRGDVGYLDYQAAVIEWRRMAWENFVADLRAKQGAGALNETEAAQLALVDGVATEQPAPTEVVESASEDSNTLEPPDQQQPPVPYPASTEASGISGYPVGDAQTMADDTATVPSPTSAPAQQSDEVGLPFRFPDPSTLAPEEFDISVLSVEIDGDLARAVVNVRAVTSEMLLVKIEGNWYIVGGRLLKFEP